MGKYGMCGKTDGQYKQRDRNYKKESKGNARNKKHSNRDQEWFGGLISRLDSGG